MTAPGIDGSDSNHVLLTADCHCAVPALVTAASILSAYRSAMPLVLHLASDKPDADFEAAFRRLVAQYPFASFAFHLIDIDGFTSGKPLPYGTPSYMTYARLLCGRFLPAALTRVLYIDTDMLCLRNLGDLFATVKLDKPVGMVAGHYANRACPWKACVPFAPQAPGEPGVVYSAGFMLLDLQAWRERTETMLDVFATHRNRLPHVDQSVINYVWRGQVQPLDRVWNHWAGAADTHADEVLHFIGRVKPWSPAIQTSGPVALWWAYYAHHVRPILPERLRLEKEHDWRLLFTVPLRERIVVSFPHLVNILVGACRLGRRSARQRRDDLDYLVAKRDVFRGLYGWMKEFRQAADDVQAGSARRRERQAPRPASPGSEAAR